MEVGDQMMAGMEQGLGVGTGGIVAAIQQLIDQVSAMMEVMLATINQKVAAVQTTLDQVASDAMATVDTVAGAMTMMASETVPAVATVATAGFSATDQMLMDLGLNPGATSGFTGVTAPAPLVTSAKTQPAAVTINISVDRILGKDEEMLDWIERGIGRRLRTMGVMA